MALEISLDGGDARAVEVTRRSAGATVWIGGREHAARLEHGAGPSTLTLDSRTTPIWVFAEHDVVHVHSFGRAWRLEVVDRDERARAAAEQFDLAVAPMPGTVLSLAVADGDEVRAGEVLVTIESMKMQSEIVATRDGAVERVFLAVGETFDRGATLVSLVPLAREGAG
jgi:acetyl/propionyl-CoA carboxylase alpha subunit